MARTQSHGGGTTAACIPVYNEDYLLRLAVAAIAPHVDEVVIHDDGSTDLTPQVCAELKRQWPNVTVHRSRRRLGWCEARNRLLGLAASHRWLLFMDSDDIYAGTDRRLLEAARQECTGHLQLGLCELWGDFRHGTGRGFSTPHHDPCHVLIDRAACPEIRWTHCDAFTRITTGAVRPEPSGRRQFFHAKGVKPDERLVERRLFREWLRSGKSTAKRRSFPKLAPTPEHRQALDILLRNPIDPCVDLPPGIKLPGLLREERRFELRHAPDGRHRDRVDHERETTELRLSATNQGAGPFHELPLVVAITAFNNRRYVRRCLAGLLRQNYGNFRIIYVDDASTDGAAEAAERLMARWLTTGRARLFRNRRRQRKLANLVRVFAACHDDEYIVELDGDDHLAHRGVLAAINCALQTTRALVLHANYVNHPPALARRRRLRVMSAPTPPDVIRRLAYRRQPWIYSGLRIYSARLARNLRSADLRFRDFDGRERFFPVCADMAVFFPLLEMAGGRVAWIPEPLLIHQVDSPLNDNVSVPLARRLMISAEIRRRPIVHFTKNPITAVGADRSRADDPGVKKTVRRILRPL